MFEHDWTAETIRKIVEECLDQFGPERVMFGSNFPVDKLYSGYKKIADAYRMIIPGNMQAQVMRGTAAKFYDLPTAK